MALLTDVFAIPLLFFIIARMEGRNWLLVIAVVVTAISVLASYDDLKDLADDGYKKVAAITRTIQS
jgi:peptidoglycan/LPS O-acetylase OafA/YrhL